MSKLWTSQCSHTHLVLSYINLLMLFFPSLFSVFLATGWVLDPFVWSQIMLILRFPSVVEKKKRKIFHNSFLWPKYNQPRHGVFCFYFALLCFVFKTGGIKINVRKVMEISYISTLAVSALVHKPKTWFVSNLLKLNIILVTGDQSRFTLNHCLCCSLCLNN